MLLVLLLPLSVPKPFLLCGVDASKTSAGENQTGSRRVMFGFLEASVNRQGNGTNRWSGSCKDQHGHVVKLVEPEALPREVTTRSDGTIAFAPVKELETLRITSSALRQDVALHCGDTVLLGDLGHAVEITASFITVSDSATLAANGASYGVSILSSASGDESTIVGMDGKRFFVDKRNSTLRNATPPVFKDLMIVDHASNVSSATQLRVFVDGRVVEVFLGGKALTTMVYPQSNASTKLGLFMRCDETVGVGRSDARVPGNTDGTEASIKTRVEAWAMRPITVSPTPRHW